MIDVKDVVSIAGEDSRNQYLVKDVFEGANGLRAKLHGKRDYVEVSDLVLIKKGAKP